MYVSALQIETIDKVQAMINNGNTFDEILRLLSCDGYALCLHWSGRGRMPKNRVNLEKNGHPAFVELRKKQNGQCGIAYDWLF